MKIERVRSFFAERKIEVTKGNLHAFFEKMQLPEVLKEYLKLMENPIDLQQTDEGAAVTYLLSQEEIKNCLQDVLYKILPEHTLFPVGKGLNGDIVCLNLKNNHVGYVYHEELCENCEEFADLYQELPLTLDQFLDFAFYSPSYPVNTAIK